MRIDIATLVPHRGRSSCSHIFVIHAKKLDNQLILMNADNLPFSIYNIACAVAVSVLLLCFCLFMTSIAHFTHV